jgi:hypothetical protein
LKTVEDRDDENLKDKRSELEVNNERANVFLGRLLAIVLLKDL